MPLEPDAVLVAGVAQRTRQRPERAALVAFLAAVAGVAEELPLAAPQATVARVAAVKSGSLSS
jgi:hypothetical protein